MRAVLRRIQATKGLSLSIIATGMHLSQEFGFTVNEIERDGFEIFARIPSLRREDTGAGMLHSFSRFLRRLVDVLGDLKPDFLLLLGDRWEMLAGAIVGSYMNIPVAHIHGGELTGSIDEPNRHVITRFAHLHLVAIAQHAKLLVKIGEEPRRIHIVGAPGLDDIVARNYAPPDVVAEKHGIDPRGPNLLLVQHPVVTEQEMAGSQMKKTLNAVVRFGIPTIAIYPNADAGGREMIKVMKEFADRYQFIRLYRDISRDEFLALVSMMSVIVGNSSSGIIEAASFGLPAVNIGTRQQGRIHPGNVIDVGYDERDIAGAIRVALTERFKVRVRGLKNPYGDGHTAARVTRIISKTRVTPQLLQKRLNIKVE